MQFLAYKKLTLAFPSWLLNTENVILVQKRLNEDVIDYDLLEDLVCHIDETCSEGAMLVFLPVSPPLSPCTRMIITGNIQDSHDKLKDLTKD